MIFRLLRFLFLLCIGINSSLSVMVLAEEFILATDNTPGPPYIMGEGLKFNWNKPGLEIEIYKLVEKKLNIKISFRRFPWKRCLLYLKTGKVDGIFPASFKSERMKIGVYPTKNHRVDPGRKTRNNAYYLYKLKGSSLKLRDGKFIQLNGLIGAPLGWAIVSDLKEMGVRVFELSNPSHLLNGLVKGRLAGVACLETVLDAYIKEQPETYKQVVKVFPPLKEKPYYLMFSHQFVKKNPGLAEKIWDTIKKVKKSKEFQKIVKKYK